MGIKQVIVMRTDTDPPMRKGKMIAQGSHASMAFVVDRINRELAPFTEYQLDWMEHGHRKVCVRVDSERELLDLHTKAVASGVEAHIVTDLGLTEFKEETVTCLAIGPDTDEKIDAITGHLKLL